MNQPATRKISADVLVEAVAAEPREQHALEADAFRILDVAEAELENVVFGFTVGCNFATNTIELAFTVDAHTDAEVHQRISEVIETIDPLLSAGHFQTRTAPSVVCATD